MRRCLRRNRPGPYQVQAAISAGAQRRPDCRRHRLARRSSRSTTSCWRWRRRPSSRSTARSPSPRWPGRRRRSRWSTVSTWPRHHLFHAVRADLLRRLGRRAEAAAAYDAAIALAGNDPERAFLQRRRDELPPSAPVRGVTTPLPLDVTFTAPIEKDGAFPTYLTVPDSAELFGTRRAVKVTGTTDGHPFAATLMPSGPDRTGCRCARRSARRSARTGPASRSPSTCSSG